MLSFCAVLLAVSIFSGEAGAQPSASGSGSLQTQLDQALETTDATAIGILQITQDGQDIAMAGVQSDSDPVPVTSDSLWHIGSNAKAMTATLALLLERQGVLQLGENLPAFFPSLALHPQFATVTLGDLLTHRSGLTANMSLWQMQTARDENLPEQRLALAQHWLTRSPANPHDGFHYSNLGYVLAGAAMETRTGVDFEVLMEDKLFAPLGITTAGIGAPGPDATVGHRRLFGFLTEMPNADNPAIMSPAGTYHMSLGDWGKFAAAHLPEAGLLSQREQDILHRPIEPRSASGPEETLYAMGWGVSRDIAGHEMLLHAGSNTMWFALIRLDPERGTGVLVTANAATGRTERAVRALAETAMP